MTTPNVDTVHLIQTFDTTTQQLLRAIASFSESQFHSIPFEASWTPAQVYEHIIKSNKSIVKALTGTGVLTSRRPDERALEIKELFLSTTNKFLSPQSVFPTLGNLEKEEVTERLKELAAHLNLLISTINLYETVTIPGFGQLTKLELLHFIIYHSQRHLRQLQNMLETNIAGQQTGS
ncbi:MAG: DinB family protein [Bacteroidota bacterium]|nr:DinB family protein [Bacteroidota bacterium]